MAAVAALFAANRKKPDVHSLEAAAVRRKNLGFLQVDFVSDPRQGLKVLCDSLGDIENGSEFCTWKLSSSAEWLKRGLIATADYLYVLSMHKKDSFENVQVEDAANGDNISNSSKGAGFVYGFVDKISMENIVSIAPISTASTTSSFYDGKSTLPVSELTKELTQFLHMDNLEGRRKLFRWTEDISNAAFLNASFRIVIRDSTNTSQGASNSEIASGGPLDKFDISHRSKSDKRMDNDSFSTHFRQNQGNAFNLAPLGSVKSGGIPQPPQPDKVIYFSTGSNEGARDKWVECLRKAAIEAHFWALWRRKRDAAQSLLHRIYTSSPFQACIVFAITANFLMSVVETHIGSDEATCLADAMNATLALQPAATNSSSSLAATATTAQTQVSCPAGTSPPATWRHCREGRPIAFRIVMSI